MKFYPFIVFLFFLQLPFLGTAQKQFRVSVTSDDYKGFKKNIKTEFKDSAKAHVYLKKLRNSAVEQGYLLASLDTLIFSENACLVDFYIGEKFHKVYLSISHEDLNYIKKEGKFREKIILKQAFRAEELGSFMNEVHRTLLMDGYPFAKVMLSNIVIDGHSATAKLSLEINQRLKWKEIHIKGDTAVSESFLSSLLQVKIGDWYDETVLEKASQRIQQVTFLSEIKPCEVLFTREGVELFVYLKSKPLSSINGFLGLQPNPAQNNYFLTGELALKLLNVLKSGEKMDLKWQNVQSQTQQLNVQTNFPFLFKSPFGVDGKFNLYKRDSTFLDLKGKFAIQYYLRGGNFVSFYFERNASSLLSGAANNVSFTGLSNIKSNNYGIGLTKRNIDYLSNPQRGFSIEISSSVGQRQSQKTDTSDVLRTLVFKGDSDLEFYLPLAKRHILRFANHTSFISTPEIYQNELFRFGGLNTQRGFNEQEIFASTYTTFSIEYRFLLDQNSRAFLFFDQSFYERNSVSYLFDSPYGFGAGFSFATAIGVFSIQYALGSQQNNPILFKNGKIHFGYIAYF